MAEPKDDPDELCSVHKISNYLGNSRLEESLNDFLDLHSEELRLELRRAESPLMPGKRREAGGLEKTDKCGQDVGETTERGEGEQERGFENGGLFSHRVHSIYQEFLAVVQGNLEEFLEAEGLTEGQLRDACEQEMQAKDPGGLSFMHTLISSWEFSSFIALVSSFLDEGSGSEEEEGEGEEEEEEDEEEAEEGGEGGDASCSSASYSSPGEEGAESLSLDDRSRRGRCRPRTNSSSSSGSTNYCCGSSGRDFVPRSPSPGAAGVAVVADCSFAAKEGQKEVPLFATTTTTTSCRRRQESASRQGGGCAGGADVDVAGTAGEVGSGGNTRGQRSGAAATTACCRERSKSPGGGRSSGNPPGTVALLSEARGTAGGTAGGLTTRGRRRSSPELPTRAERKS